MVSQIYLNLPVKDLKKSMDFFGKLGFKFNPTFTDANAACLILGKNIYSMLVVEKLFSDFAKTAVSNTKKGTEILIAIDVKTKKEVDAMLKKAVSAGGSLYTKPTDHGWMYSHSFADLDGHKWEIMYMDEKALQNEMRKNKKKTASDLDRSKKK